MKLIKKLRVRKYKYGSMREMGLFLCPQCKKLKEKIIKEGRRKKTCSGSCGNIYMKPKHGDARKGNLRRLYRIMRCMHQRCYNKKHHAYKNYGGKGVTVCAEWHDYRNFKQWALANGYADNLTIDRIDSDGNYEPSNCQWISLAFNTFKAKAKFTMGEAEQIKKIYAFGKFSQKRIAKAYGASQPCIQRIVNNESYKGGICT